MNHLILNTETGVLRAQGGGDTVSLLLRSNGDVIELERGGAPLGDGFFGSDMKYATYQLAHGDQVITMIQDGVWRGPSSSAMRGQRAFTGVMDRVAAARPQNVQETLALLRREPGATLAYDNTVHAFQWTGRTPEPARSTRRRSMPTQPRTPPKATSRAPARPAPRTRNRAGLRAWPRPTRTPFVSPARRRSTSSGRDAGLRSTGELPPYHRPRGHRAPLQYDRRAPAHRRSGGAAASSSGSPTATRTRSRRSAWPPSLDFRAELGGVGHRAAADA